MLTEIAALDPKEQANRLKEVEKLPLKADNLIRIQNFRSNLEASSPKQATSHYTRFLDSEYSDFSLSPEILSEKLYDSVKMIRDLMNSNKKLKDMVIELTQQKKILETENTHLHNENQDLIEKIDNIQGNKPKYDNRVNVEILQLQKDKEDLLKRITILEKENKSHTAGIAKEWGWRSKRTVLRNKKPHADTSKPLSLVSDRNFEQRILVGRVTPKSVYRPLSQESNIDASKQEAISALSQILMKGVAY